MHFTIYKVQETLRGHNRKKMVLEKYSAHESVELHVSSRDVAQNVKRALLQELVVKMAEMKIIQCGMSELQRIGAPQRSLRERKATTMFDRLTAITDAIDGNHTQMVLFFGPSWRNAKEAFVVRFHESDVSDTPASTKVPSLKSLTAPFWMSFVNLLSEDTLSWLTRKPSSSAYGMHIAFSETNNSSCVLMSGEPYIIPQRQAVVMIDVHLNSEPAGFSIEQSTTLGHLYLSNLVVTPI